MADAIAARAGANAFLEGGGEMGARIRAHDWSRTELGEPSGWPQALRTSVRLMLNTGHPMYIFWGPHSICLYNDAYSRSIGPERHPSSLGLPGREVWEEIWPIIEPQISQVMGGGPATWHENALVPITRNGALEDVYWTYSYGPIDDDTAAGGVGGVLVVCAETTQQVVLQKKTFSQTERLASLFEQAPSFMAVLRGPQHVFEITNAAYLQLVGHRNVVGMPVREALPEITGQGFFELLDQVYTSNQAFVGKALTAYIQRQPNAAPEERFLDLIYQPILERDGAVSGIFVQGHDITDQKLAELAAATSETRFRRLAQSMPNHVWTALPDGNLDWFNDQVYAYSGAHPGDLDGQKWTAIVHPLDLDAAAAAWGNALTSGQPYATQFRLRRHDGAYRWHLARAVPILDAKGRVEQWVGSNTDIDDQKVAEAGQRESDLRIDLALAAAEMGVWQCRVVGGQFVDLTGDDRAMELLGGVPGEPSTFETFVSRIHPDDSGLLAPAAAQALDPDGNGLLDIEYRVTGGPADRWVHARAQAVRDADDLRLVGTVRDITHRKDIDARQTLLRDELHHRIKNTLAMVNAIATQTLKGDIIAEPRRAFSERLGALARAHDMLMASTWQSAELRDVLDGALAAHRSADGQFDIGGPAVVLGPKQAMSMALSAHELATNAAKYGALSTPTGRVQISWSLDGINEAGEREFRFVWREVGGPSAHIPTRQGFGSRLITRVLAADFGGTVGIDYGAGGIVCTLVSPARNVTPGPPPQSTSPAQGTALS